MRVGILGPLEVRDGERPVDVAGARLRALLIRLALDPGQPVSVSALAEALWADAPPADTVNAVQTLVSRLRRAVPGLGVRSGPAGYRLDLDPDDVDAERFTRLTRDGREALRDGDAPRALATLREALALWRGPALAEVGDAPYAAAAVARLAELRLTAQEDRIEAELRTGRPELLVAELDELTAAHPLRERLAALRLRTLAAAGRPAEALAGYERVRARLADELGVDPSPELRAAHLALLRGDAAPPPVAAAPRGNLRAALTTFVGRDEDLSRLTGLLDGNRLVTLIGPGGAGKTRLASAAAGRLAGGVPGGAWLVELAPITDPADVPRAVLDTLGRRDRPREPARPTVRDTLGRLVDAIAADETLIVLDNCEHVVEAAARLAEELLGRCPGLIVLATSREPLGIVGEALEPVPPLRLPPADATPADASAYPSVQLLRDRAGAVRAGFAVTDDNVADVVEICRRLDGLPLAIELAAARLRTLSPRQVAAGLDDRFRLLTGGSRTALPRHRTLRAVVDWSWGLLTGNERRLAERLAVFPASVTAESAAGVAGPAAAALLDALVDKSLLQVVGDGRFRMLETIREYGLERLAATGVAAEARAAYAAYFRDLVATAEPHLRTAGQLPWLRLLTAERENIVGALHFACDAGDADTALRIGADLALPLIIWGDDGGIGGDVLARALALPGSAPAAERAVVLAIRVITEMFHSAREPTPERVAELTDAVRAAEGARHPIVALLEPALSIFTDDTAAGIEAVDRARGHPNPWTDGTLLAMRGQIKENDGDAEGMLRDLTGAVEELRAVGERWSLSMVLSQYADALTKRGDFAAATAALEESARLVRELDPTAEPSFQLIWLAGIQARAGDIAGAKAELRRFVAARAADRDGRDAAFGLMMLGGIARIEGSLDEAAECFAEAMRRQEQAPLVAPQFRGLLQAAMGHLALARGDVPEARVCLTEATDRALVARDMPVVAIIAVGWVAVAEAEGRYERAAEMLGTSDSLRGWPDRSDADAQRLAERLREKLGDDGYAAAYARGHGLSRADALASVGGDPARCDRSGATPVGPDGERREDRDDRHGPEE
ncbi:BTAD domain-containing putative transcriptional regulator [Micromonospora sp. WMMD980]|uniref:BTAD domain-containing putative transcriptional regulator n=1 Tax=Micromonospora sp. WMMD980 TaxID=3016088 RepID=UPI002416836F|nr:BTAD domain-containing putative transcriptional regulator [Micromonospora sp. WMMD980]MDG4799305.1 BTAD domain-containing putative transcriptional regulator [Micromonospora sp. WMMD980]